MMVFNISTFIPSRNRIFSVRRTQWQLSEIMKVPGHRHFILQPPKIRKIHKTRIINSNTERTIDVIVSFSSSLAFYGFRSTAVGAANIRHDVWITFHLFGIVI